MTIQNRQLNDRLSKLQRCAEAMTMRDPIEEAGPEPPPCEKVYTMRYHPRFPSGYCVECGAGPEESCKHPLATGEPEEG
jgi:hypothetical protein